MFSSVCLFAVFLVTAAATRNANDVPYDLWPALTAVDEYQPCMDARGSYWFISAKLSANSSNRLYNTLAEHSLDNLTHFDRTNIHRGICLEKTCHGFLHTSPNMTIVIESCLNDTLKREHGLSARVFKSFCNAYQDSVQFDRSDFAFAVVVIGLLVVNLIGSVYDFCGGTEDRIVGRTLICFSVRRNWQRLMGPPCPDPRFRRLRCFSAYRVIFCMCCILGHAGITFHHAIENPEFIEETYKVTLYLLMYRGYELIQMMFIMSGVLLAYIALQTEEHVTRWKLHEALIWRWLRLTPVYAVVFFFCATWMRYMGEGPFWKAVIGVDADDCRRDWWAHLLYVNNYVNGSRCMLHTWTMALDMQATVVGLSIFYLLKSNKARKVAIRLVLAVGVMGPAAAVFFKNLHPVTVASPEMILNWCVEDLTFNNLYKRGHTNLVGYALGWALGYIIYNLEDSDFEAKKFKKFGTLSWLLVPTFFLVNMTGAVFFEHTAAVSLRSRVVYSGMIKLLSGLLLAVHVFLTIVKADDFCTRIFSWRGWVPLARLTFCIYMVHMSVLRIIAGSLEKPVHASVWFLTKSFAESFTISYLIAVPLFLLVEAPFAQLTRLAACIASSQIQEKED